MENKKDIIVRKIDTFIFNVKNLNIIISIMLSIFLITLGVVYSKRYTQYQLENKNYEAMIKEANEHQMNVIYTNISPNSGVVDKSKSSEDPIFKDAKEAVVTAFSNFNNYSSYEIESVGISNAVALGQNVEMRINSYAAKYGDGLEYARNVRVETKTSFGQSGASEIVCVDGKKYMRDGNNIRIENNNCVADFNSNYHQVNTQIPKIADYIINNETVKLKRAFSFVRDQNNKILYYKATVTLDPELSTTENAINIMEQGGTEKPIYTQVEISCVIDRDGNLISYEVTETLQLTKKIVFNVTATTITTIKYTILSYNTTPSHPRPNI